MWSNRPVCHSAHGNPPPQIKSTNPNEWKPQMTVRIRKNGAKNIDTRLCALRSEVETLEADM